MKCLIFYFYIVNGLIIIMLVIIFRETVYFDHFEKISA